MSELIKTDIVVVAIILFVMALIVSYVIVKGPRTLDRLVALNGFYIIIGIAMVILGCYSERTIYFDFGLLVIVLGFIKTIIISKYLEGKL